MQTRKWLPAFCLWLAWQGGAFAGASLETAAYAPCASRALAVPEVGDYVAQAVPVRPRIGDKLMIGQLPAEGCEPLQIAVAERLEPDAVQVPGYDKILGKTAAQLLDFSYGLDAGEVYVVDAATLLDFRTDADDREVGWKRSWPLENKEFKPQGNLSRPAAGRPAGGSSGSGESATSGTWTRSGGRTRMDVVDFVRSSAALLLRNVPEPKGLFLGLVVLFAIGSVQVLRIRR